MENRAKAGLAAVLAGAIPATAYVANISSKVVVDAPTSVPEPRELKVEKYCRDLRLNAMVECATFAVGAGGKPSYFLYGTIK